MFSFVLDDEPLVDASDEKHWDKDCWLQYSRLARKLAADARDDLDAREYGDGAIPRPEPSFARIAERNTPPGFSGIHSGRPDSSAQRAASPPASTTRSSNRSGPPCNANSWTARPGPAAPSCHRRCSNGSRASTSRRDGTPPSETSAPSSSNDFTTTPRPRHDQHTRTVRETGSGYQRGYRCGEFFTISSSIAIVNSIVADLGPRSSRSLCPVHSGLQSRLGPCAGAVLATLHGVYQERRYSRQRRLFESSSLSREEKT